MGESGITLNEALRWPCDEADDSEVGGEPLLNLLDIMVALEPDDEASDMGDTGAGMSTAGVVLGAPMPKLYSPHWKGSGRVCRARLERDCE